MPLAFVAAIAIAIILLVIQHNDRKREQQRQRAAAELKEKIEEAKEHATAKGKRWRVIYQRDPASDVKIARIAYIESNDSLCTLSVQERISGDRLSGLDCHDLNISEWDDIEVKFSSAETSVKMDLKSYKDGKGVYIPSFQFTSSGYFEYNNFIAGLKNGQAVAIKIPSAGGVWVAFSLEGSPEALNQLGKERAKTQDLKGSSKTIIASAKALEDQLLCETRPSPGKAIRAMLKNGLLKETEFSGVDGIPTFSTTTDIYVFGKKMLYVSGWEFDDTEYRVREPFARLPVGTSPPHFISVSFRAKISDFTYKERKPGNAQGVFSSIDKDNPDYRNSAAEDVITITCYGEH